MSDFHRDFERALGGDVSAMADRLGQDGHALAALRVYVNTSLKGRVDALAANYPTVRQMVGEDWFAAAALAFVEETPDASPVLAAFGRSFSDWLSRFPPAADLPFLAPVAKLDRAWTEAHLAADTPALDLDAVRAQGPRFAATPARLRPDVRVFWFDWSAPSLWLAHRDGSDGPLTWEPRAEGLLIHRPTAEVRWRRLSAPEARFLRACARGLSPAVAALQAGFAPAAQERAIAGPVAEGVFQHPTMEPHR